MTVATQPPGFASRLANLLLSVKPLAALAKRQARQMMIKRAASFGMSWSDRAAELRSRHGEAELAAVQNPELHYPEYYLRPFHAYEEGNLSWDAACEVEVAAYAVHSGIWKEAGVEGDARLRQSYHALLQQQIPNPKDIVDMGCSVGLSTFALQETYPDARLTGVDLSPYFLAIARTRALERNLSVTWVHAPAEQTGLPAAAYDLVSLCLVCHELPQAATREIFQEAKRLLRPGGYLTIMDMNPQSEVYAKMPPYIMTLLKSTEPYLDRYFTLDIAQALVGAGFESPTITPNTHRHRTIIARSL